MDNKQRAVVSFLLNIILFVSCKTEHIINNYQGAVIRDQESGTVISYQLSGHKLIESKHTCQTCSGLPEYISTQPNLTHTRD